MEPYLKANERIFLIRYIFAMGKQIMCTQKDVAQTLRENYSDSGSIEYIKEYNPAKQNFKTVSKKQLKLYFDWDLQAMDELKRNNLL